MDLTESIVPKSDQLNADDLMSGERTCTIREVKPGSGEQPVDVFLTEFEGRPFRPSKSMRRVMVAAWGTDSAGYVGHRMTLYRDPAVRFGGQDVGGIRISHMSGISKKFTLALTVTRGKRAPYIVQPLPDIVKADPATREQMQTLGAAFTKAGITNRDDRLAFVSNVIGADVASSSDLTKTQAGQVIDRLVTVNETPLDEDPNAQWNAEAGGTGG